MKRLLLVVMCSVALVAASAGIGFADHHMAQAKVEQGANQDAPCSNCVKKHDCMCQQGGECTCKGECRCAEMKDKDCSKCAMKDSCKCTDGSKCVCKEKCCCSKE